jgi:hypothetical protein
MKKALLGLLLAGLLAIPAFASGPLVGVGIEPTAGAQASIGLGWAFDSWKILAEKEAFDSWYGYWSIAALWTPDWGVVDGRVGAALGWIWEAGGLYFDDLAFIVGIQKFWGVPGIYAQLEIGTATLLIPRIGFELVFNLPETGGE